MTSTTESRIRTECPKEIALSDTLSDMRPDLGAVAVTPDLLPALGPRSATDSDLSGEPSAIENEIYRKTPQRRRTHDVESHRHYRTPIADQHPRHIEPATCCALLDRLAHSGCRSNRRIDNGGCRRNGRDRRHRGPTCLRVLRGDGYRQGTQGTQGTEGTQEAQEQGREEASRRSRSANYSGPRRPGRRTPMSGEAGNPRPSINQQA